MEEQKYPPGKHPKQKYPPGKHPNSLANLRLWEPGKSANPGGLSKEQKKLIIENAERATALRNALLRAMETVMVKEVESNPEEAAAKIAEMATSPVLALLRDAEDRGLGKPVQPVEDGTTPKTDEDLRKEAARLMRKTGLGDAEIAKLLGDDAALDE